MTYLDNLFSLEGKVAVVTGASRGIGKGLAEALMKAGAQGLMVASNEERLATATSEFRDQGLAALSYRCDLDDVAQLDELLSYVERDFARIDILVNAAGVTFGHDLLSYPDED